MVSERDVTAAAGTPGMAVSLAGMDLRNPVGTASGTFGYGWQFEPFFDVARLGFITTKGCSAVPWDGNPAPRLAEVDGGIINAVGLQNPGIRAFVEEDGSYLQSLRERGCQVVCQVAGHSIPECVAAVELYDELAPFASALELNISCPNVDKGGAALGATPEAAASVMEAVRPRTKLPVVVKLAPHDIPETARALEAAGADSLSLINTIPAMAIDVNTRRSRLCRPTAGLSGPCVHHVAVRMVWEAHQACGLPLIGIGGVETWQDAAEMILAGATCVAVGTASLHDPLAAPRVLEGLTQWVGDQGASDVNELIGAFEC